MSKNKKSVKKTSPKKEVSKKITQKVAPKKAIEKKAKIEKKAVVKKVVAKKISSPKFSAVLYSELLENFTVESNHLSGMIDRSENVTFEMLIFYQLLLSYVDEKIELTIFVDKRPTAETVQKIVTHITNFYSSKNYKNNIHSTVKNFVNGLKKGLEKLETEKAKIKKVA